MTSAPRSAARAWLDQRPNFELRSPEEQAVASFPLERPTLLLEQLGRPDRAYRVALVAGTKGKGSTAAFLASMLRAHGLRVGLYSQPHLHSYRERLRIDGDRITPWELDEALERLRPTVEACDAARPELGRLTAYEITTALGLDWFARREVDWAVLEVGLGGRLDATNVVEPAVAVITSISYDHMHVLGNTLPKIAAEKAGIIKPGGLVVSAPQRPSAMQTIRQVARRQEARLSVVGAAGGAPRLLSAHPLRVSADVPHLPREPFGRFAAESARRAYPELAIQLGGAHQVTNALTALAALEAAEQHGLQVELAAVRVGLAETRWPGRFEVVRSAPLLVIDGAHNGDSAVRLVEALHLHFDYDRLHVVLGVFADKDLAAILRPFREAASLRAVKVPNPRARPAAEVAAAARRAGIAAHEGGPIDLALEAALAEADRRDLVVATGSLAVVAAAREAMGLT